MYYWLTEQTIRKTSQVVDSNKQALDPAQILSPPNLLYNGYWIFPGRKEAIHPHLAPRLKKE